MLVQLFSTLSVTDVFSILTPGLISYHIQLQNKTVHMFSIFSVIFSLGYGSRLMGSRTEHATICIPFILQLVFITRSLRASYMTLCHV